MITYKVALQLIEEALEIAKTDGVLLSIAVCDPHGELVAFCRMDGVGLQTAPLARAKAYTSARMRKATRLLGEWAVDNNKDISHWVDASFTGLGGGLPILNGDEVIGGMGVSGLSPEKDEEVVQKSINKVFQ